MARFLALDADTTHLQILSATVKGSAVRLEKTAAWDEDQLLTAATAERAGGKFRETIKAAGIGPAPLLICISRERVIFKELKIPVVPAHDEPAVVRFQAQKEFTDAGDVVLDYTSLGPASNNEQRVLVAAAKKDFVAACKKLADTAGVKLVGITPRPFATLAGLNQACAAGLAPKPAPDEAIALLVRGDKWGEFAISRNGIILQSRSIAGPALSNETALLGEIRRTLAVHSNQNPSQPVAAVYVAEPDSPGGLRERLQNSLSFPVHAYEPVIGVSLPDGPHGAYAGLAGMFALAAASPTLPVNFAAPRQPKPPADPGKRMLFLVGGGLFALFMVMVIVGYMQLSAKNSKVAVLQRQKNNADNTLRGLDNDAKKMKALDEWEAVDINWLDELYDSTARMRDNEKMRTVKWVGGEDTKKGRAQVGTLYMEVVSTNDPVPLMSLMDDLHKETTYLVTGKNTIPNRVTSDRSKFPLLHKINPIELEKRPLDKYTRQFTATAPPKRTRPNVDDGADDIGGFGP